MRTDVSPSHRPSRRVFLQRVSTSGLFALSPRWLKALRVGKSHATLHVTNAIVKYAERPPVYWTPAAAGVRAATIEIDSTRQFQSILGFGAALTDASCFLLNGMPPAARHAFLSEAYSPAGMNLSLGRCCIGSSDYSRNVYSYDDVPGDTSLGHFSLRHDEAYIVPTLREIRAIQPDLFLLASPWSPPGWMKTYGTNLGGRITKNYLDVPFCHMLWEMENGTMKGGWMAEQYLGVYAQYLQKFLQGYAQAGVPVQALTPQNEPLTAQNGRMPACRWSPDLEKVFIRDHLGPLLHQQQLGTQIWLLDHDYTYYQRVASQLQDSQLAKYVDGVAWHGYTGTPDQMSLVHRNHPDVPFHWTEGGPFIDDPGYATDWAKWGGIFTDALENWCRCAITWNLMLDPSGKPNLGPFTCGGLVTLREDGGILRSGQYHALRHFSRHLHRGGTRIASGTNDAGLRHVAAENPDGGFALVVTNPGEARDVRIIHDVHQASFTMPSNAIATLAW